MSSQADSSQTTSFVRPRPFSREALAVIAYNAATLSGFLMGILLGWIIWS